MAGPRSIWKGTVGFGMVSVPVKLYTATEERTVRFNQIHRKCGGRIQMPKFCPTCDQQVDPQELVKGYEVAKGEYVLMEDSDFQALPLKSMKSIEVMEFVEAGSIDPRQVNKGYFLSPDEAGVKAFGLFLRAMDEVGLVGVVKLCMREREHLAAIRPFGQCLLLQTLFWSDELRKVGDYEVALPAVTDRELDMAKTLIQTLVNGQPDLTKYQDAYRAAVMEIIQAKLNGETITIRAEAPKPAMDLVDALMASINQAQAGKVEVGVN